MSPKNPSRSFSRAFSVARSELKYTFHMRSVNRPDIDEILGLLELTFRQHKEKRAESEVMRHRSELNKNIQLSHLTGVHNIPTAEYKEDSQKRSCIERKGLLKRQCLQHR